MRSGHSSLWWEEKGVVSQAKRAPRLLPLPVYWAWSPRWTQALRPVNHTLRSAHRAGRPVPSVTCISSHVTCPLQSPVIITVILSLPALFAIVKALRSILGVPHSFLSTPSSAVPLRKRLGVPEGQAVTPSDWDSLRMSPCLPQTGVPWGQAAIPSSWSPHNRVV